MSANEVAPLPRHSAWQLHRATHSGLKQMCMEKNSIIMLQFIKSWLVMTGHFDCWHISYHPNKKGIFMIFIVCPYLFRDDKIFRNPPMSIRLFFSRRPFSTTVRNSVKSWMIFNLLGEVCLYVCYQHSYTNNTIDKVGCYGCNLTCMLQLQDMSNS